MDWEDISFVTGSKIRFKILLELRKSNKTPSGLAASTKNPISHVSLALNELSKRELIKCLTPNVRKNKFYQITDKGNKILDDINKETGRNKRF
tara:strand:+ start:187 stop:465 length:279 start_codon:yes stop_codon:yes gene_type:complete